MGWYSSFRHALASIRIGAEIRAEEWESAEGDGAAETGGGACCDSYAGGEAGLDEWGAHNGAIDHVWMVWYGASGKELKVKEAKIRGKRRNGRSFVLYDDSF